MLIFVSAVTSNVPAIAVLPLAAVTTNLSVLIFVSPVTSNVELNVDAPVTPSVPAIAVLPLAAVTTNLSVLTFASPVTSSPPAIAVLPLAAVTTNLSVLIFVSPVTSSVPDTEVFTVCISNSEAVSLADTENKLLLLASIALKELFLLLGTFKVKFPGVVASI